MQDVCADINYTSTDVNIFTETRLCDFDDDNIYHLTNNNI